MIYLDHAATTPLHPEVIGVITEVMNSSFGNPSSSYALGREAKDLQEKARGEVADLIGAQSGEIYFTGGGTESDNLSLWGVVCSRQGSASHIITSSIEHPAIMNTCAFLTEHLACTVTYLPVDGDGLVDPNDVRKAIGKDTALISVMQANNEVGTIQPIEEIAAIAREYGIPFHVDAVQAVGHIPLDVDQLGVDLLSLSGHKFYGPKGVGALYVREGTPFVPPLSGGGQEGGYRSGTQNIPGIAGLGQAAVVARREMEQQMKILQKMRDELVRGVEEKIPGAKLIGSRRYRLPHHVSFAFADIEGESLLWGLDLAGIAVSAGSACSTGNGEPSHVLRAMNLSEQYLNGVLRLTLGRANSEEDVPVVIDKLSELVHKFSQLSPK